jgi:hypothetical protein
MRCASGIERQAYIPAAELNCHPNTAMSYRFLGGGFRDESLQRFSCRLHRWQRSAI